MDIPEKIATPFASGTGAMKNTIPENGTTDDVDASMQMGFPPRTMSTDSDRAAPAGEDFNGILYKVTVALQHLQAGGTFPFDNSFATAIGGYPKGAILSSTDGQRLFVNTVANNSSNPELDGSTGWAVIPSDVLSLLDGKLSLTGGEMTGQILSTTQNALSLTKNSGNTFVARAERSDTGNAIALGIGVSGTSRGIYDYTTNSWLISYNGNGELESNGEKVILSGGGTMTGELVFNKTSTFIRNSLGNAVIGHDANGNNAYLSSPNGSNYLRVGDDGSCKWKGKDVAAIDSNNPGTTWDGYTRFTSRLQVCFGGVNGGSTGAVAVTFPIAFGSAPIVLVSRSAGDNTYTAADQPFSRKQTATGFEVYFPAVTNARWMAIGWGPA